MTVLDTVVIGGAQAGLFLLTKELGELIAVLLWSGG
jgi:hypothetical protein